MGNEAENLGAQMATKDCATLKAAQNWAAETVDDAEDAVWGANGVASLGNKRLTSW